MLTTIDMSVDHHCRDYPPLHAGLLALGWLHGVNTGNAGEATDLELAEAMAATCYEMYRQTPIGLAPEIVFFKVSGEDAGYPKEHTDDIGNGDFIVKPAVRLYCHASIVGCTLGMHHKNLLCQHRIPTTCYDQRRWNRCSSCGASPATPGTESGAGTFSGAVHRGTCTVSPSPHRAFERSSRVETGGYTCLDSVLHTVPLVRDKQESFWLAETLKYLYLLFDDTGLVPLEEYVFNTEAHPLPVLGSAADRALSRHYLHAAGWGWLAPNDSVEALEHDLARVQAMAERVVGKSTH